MKILVEIPFEIPLEILFGWHVGVVSAFDCVKASESSTQRRLRRCNDVAGMSASTVPLGATGGRLGAAMAAIKLARASGVPFLRPLSVSPLFRQQGSAA